MEGWTYAQMVITDWITSSNGGGHVVAAVSTAADSISAYRDTQLPSHRLMLQGGYRARISARAQARWTVKLLFTFYATIV